MKLIRNMLCAVLLMAGLNACFDTPTYPVVPQIEILNDELYYGKSKKIDGNDSIVVAIKFKDGDGDIGLSDSDIDNLKFAQQYYYFIKDNFLIIDSKSENNDPSMKIINYQFKKRNPSVLIDINPAGAENLQPLSKYDFVTPYNCTNWELRRDKNGVVIDTIFTAFNRYRSNIFVDFYTVESNRDTTRFDPFTYYIYPNCETTGYNGAIPILSKDLGKKSPLDGKIIYSIKDPDFEGLFSIKTLRLRISIIDRELHKSNTVFSKDFKLSSIKR